MTSTLHKLGLCELNQWEKSGYRDSNSVKYIFANLSDASYKPTMKDKQDVLNKSGLNKEYKIIMWDHLSCDYEKKLNIDYSIEQMKKVKNGSIVVFHDSEKSFENLKQLLPQLLAYYCSEGYQLLAIPQN